MNFNLMQQGLPTAQQSRLAVCALTALLTLSSCGGSSSTTALKSELPSPVAKDIKDDTLVPDVAGKEAVPPAELDALPLISLNSRQLADPNVLLNLNATVTAATGATIVKTLWTQVTGPAVSIASPLQLNNEIVIPDVTVATTLEFRLTAQDSKGKINSATVSILVKPVPYFIKVSGGAFIETDQAAVFRLQLSEASNFPVTFSYTTQDGSASAGLDYTVTSGLITFAPGETSKILSVPLLDDILREGNETFSLLVTATDGEITHNASGIALINNGVEALIPQTLRFSTQIPAPIKVNSQYTNLLETNPGTGAVLYTSSNPQIAKVDDNGLVVTLTPGTTTITATKAADAIYLAAEASYDLVVNAGSAPFVGIRYGYYNEGNIFAELGEPLTIYGSDYLASYDSLSSHSWTSDIDGTLDSGTNLYTDTLTQGIHTLSETLTSSEGTFSENRLVSVGNLTHRATIVDAVPITCGSLNFFSDPYAIANLYFGRQYYDDGCEEGVFTSFTWDAPVDINSLNLIISTDLPIQNYIVEYLDKNTSAWKTLTLSSSNIVDLANSDSDVSEQVEVHQYTTGKITTEQVRIWQPLYGRLNEVVIFGNNSDFSFSSIADVNPIALQPGEQLVLTGTAFDKEDGQLPTQTQLQSQTKLPFWSSDIDGVLATGTTLITTSLQQGLHLITFSASDGDGNSRTRSIPVIVGNVAPLATTDARSASCWGNTCYSTNNINDNSLAIDAGIYNSWMNMGLDSLEGSESEWISLNWDTPITTHQIDLYSTRGKVIQAYDIEYLSGSENWVKVVGVTDNTAVHRSHVIAPITTRELRVKVLKGSAAEPNFARINELVVFGTKAAASAPQVSSSNINSSLGISAILNLTEASSSTMNPSGTSFSLVAP